jgi:hypothetical protein
MSSDRLIVEAIKMANGLLRQNLPPMHSLTDAATILRLLARDGVGMILVESPDRFARDLSVQITGHDYLRSLGVELVPTSASLRRSSYDTSLPMIALLRNFPVALSGLRG